MRALSIRTASRVAGFAAVAFAITATAFHLPHDTTNELAQARNGAPSSAPDLLAKELARCRSIRLTTEDVVSCEAAWAENRRRFFTYEAPTPLPVVSRKNADIAHSNPTAK